MTLKQEVDLMFARYEARLNLSYLVLYRSLNITPPIVRWMPRTRKGKRLG